MSIELKFIEHKEATEEKIKYQRDCYTIGNYNVTRDIEIYEDGKTYEQFEIRADHEMRFLPDIYFNSCIFNEDVEKFKIQTTSYGSLSSAEIQQVIDGYKEALEVVNILTNQFIK